MSAPPNWTGPWALSGPPNPGWPAPWPPPPVYGHPVPSLAVRKTDGFAIASLVLGLFFWFPGLAIITGLLALIFGYIALSRIRQSGTAGRGMAIAGVVLGWVSVVGWVLAIIAEIASSVTQMS
ncbi:MAG: DUF4190 domain-containing protein [Acidothermus sp.]|nr:DUF4190 domain-containing protein [Acidothermus sp.]